MPKTFKGKDGRVYYDVPGMEPIPVEDLHPAPVGLGERVWSGVKGASPEIVAGLTALLAPATGGVSLAAAPLAAAGTEALKQWSDTGSVDPTSVALRGGLNAIPGGLARLWTSGSHAVPAALEAAGTGEGWLATVAKGLQGLGRGRPSSAFEAAPEVVARAAPALRKGSGLPGLGAVPHGGVDVGAQIALLTKKLQDPALNASAKAAVLTTLKRLETVQRAAQTGSLSTKLRALLGLGSGAAQMGVGEGGP